MRNTSALQPMKSIFLPGLALLLSLTSTTLAQENGELGRMWTFENPPLAYLEKEYGFKPDQKWLDSLRLGSLRMGGEDILSGFWSASFVSPKGLIMTSTRRVRAAVVQTLDAPGSAMDGDPRKILEIGFVAAALGQEIRLRSRRDEWLTAAQLVRATNITDEVNQGVAPTDEEAQIKEKREANKKTILDTARKADPKLVPQIVSLYQGAVFQLYQYKVYDDVRLVVLPHVETAHFGGTPDNFTYPRYNIDFAFLRAYEDGKPAQTTNHYFRWKSGGAKKDELVFVSGIPDTTNRLFTKAQLEFERDIRIPIQIEWHTSMIRLVNETPFVPESASWHSFWWAFILKLEYGQKAARGNPHGLEDATLMAQKTAAEKAFRDLVMADKALAAKYRDLWDRLDSVVHEVQARFHVPAHIVFHLAVAIVRSCDPAETAEHREQAKKKLESWAGATVNAAYPGTAFCLDHFVRARSWLPEDDPFFTKVLGGRSPEEFFDLLDPARNPSRSGKQPRPRSWLGYAEQRDALVKSGWESIQKSEDPLVVAARELVILMRKNEKLGDELDAKEEALRAEIGRALFACYGRNVSPDATMTLRFTDGVVRGFPLGGTIASSRTTPHRAAPFRTVPYRTTFYGLYGRNAAFDNEFPFNLPQIWLDRRDKIDMTKSVNFVSTNDITAGSTVFETDFEAGHRWRGTGGNSGSVVVNKELEVVGMVADGNIESLHNDFVFKDDVPRAVSVHVDGIMEALVKIYDAHHIAKELTGK